MNYSRLVACCMMSVWLSFSATAQTDSETKNVSRWSLDSCINYAKSQNIQLKLTQLTIESSEINVHQAKMNRLPDLNGSASHSYNWGRSIDPFTNQFVSQRIQSNNFSLNSNTTLFNGFRLKNTIEQNELQLEADKLNFAQAQNDLSLNIASNYLQVILNQEILENARKQRQSTQAQYDRTKKLVEAGTLARASLYDLDAQLAADQQQIVVAENNMMLAKLQLRQLLQLPPNQDFDIVVPAISDPSAILDSKNPYVIYQNAQTTQPNIKAAEMSTQAAVKGIDVAKSGRIPSLSLFGSAGTNYSSAQREGVDRTVLPTIDGYSPTTLVILDDQGNPTSQLIGSPNFVYPTTTFGFFDQIQESFRYNLGLSLQIPIFNRFQVENNIERAQIQAQNAKLTAENTRLQLYQTIEQAYISARAAKASFEASQQRVKALEETVRVTEARLEAGATNATEYTVVKNNLAVAQADLVRSKYEFIFRIKVLEFYEGEELKF